MSFNEKTLLERLDKLFDEEKFSDIEQEIKKIPREDWSLELRFRLVSALNNQKKLAQTVEELKEIEPLCKTPAEKARFLYQTGYAHYINDCEMTASHCFKDALAADPDDTAGLNIKSIIEESDGYIHRALEELRGIARIAVEAVTARCSEIPESRKKELSDEEFALYLGYPAGLRVPPGMEKPLLFDEFFKKYAHHESVVIKKYLSEYFGITDKESFVRFYRTDARYNLYYMAGDVLEYLGGKPTDIEGAGKELLEDSAEFLSVIRDCFPRANVLAWDISEKIGVARHCFGCGFLTESDYAGCLKALSDAALEKFSSFGEYMVSLVLGGGFFMFLDGNRSIKSAMDYMNMILPILLSSPLGSFKWGYCSPN